MGYLVPSDYTRLIQEVNLNQVISGNALLKEQAESVAIEEAKSYLRAKYDVNSEFTNTGIYNPAATYKANNRVYLDAPFYNSKITYALNTMVLRQGKVYLCKVAIIIAEEFDDTHWTELGAQYDFFYCSLPKPLFDINGFYNKGDQVFWKDKTYTNVIATQPLTHDQAIQYASTNNFPLQNVFPDDTQNGIKYWGAGVAYSVAAGKILDTTFFTKGDNRNQQIVVYVMDMLIYHLYRTAISWLNKVAKGNDVVADIAVIQPAQGERIRFGSRPKQENFY